jgi:excisionase family DNA binding protein
MTRRSPTVASRRLFDTASADETARIGEPSPLDRFRMRAALERSGGSGRGAAPSPIAAEATPVGSSENRAEEVADEVLTRAEVAKLLKVCPKTVSRLVREEGLPAASVLKNEYRFRRLAVLAWLEARESSGHGTK